MADCFITNGSSGEYVVNFSSHNILLDYVVNSKVCEKSVNGETVTYKIAGNLAIAWYFIVTNIPLSPKKMYKLEVKNFNGYGRLAISSYGNGGTMPYINQNMNIVGSSFNDDNILISAHDNTPKFFYVTPKSKSVSEVNNVNCGLWFCSDDYNNEYGNEQNEHSFEIGLYEQV